jgi:Zn-dependent peptidase ImmA (M78 family)
MGFNPSRLTLARRRRGWTKKKLAEVTRLSERIITAYEAGEKTPSAATLELLGEQLEFPSGFFDRPDLDAVSERGASFRSMSRMPAARRDRALASGELGIELSDWLDSHFAVPAPSLPDLRHIKDSEAAAIALRTKWALGDKPIANMVRLLEAKGVRIFSLEEECYELDAFSFWRETRPFVFLNTMKSSERSRFDAAHELAHLVLHRHGQPQGREAEKEADSFASAFLMPRTSLLAFAPRTITLDRLIAAKHGWNVAVSALAHRLHELGLVTEWHYRKLCIEIQKLGYRTNEPSTAPREMSQVLEKVFSMLRTEGKSKSDIAGLLSWPLRELNALVFGLVVSTLEGGTQKPHRASKLKGEHLTLVN